MSLANKYVKHNLKAKSKRGHGIHSPFVFDLCLKVFSRKFKGIKEIEKVRSKLLHSKEKITFTEIGAGSSVDKQTTRKVNEVARFSSNKKVNKLLYKLVEYIKPLTIIEFGTSFGFSSMYLAKANPQAKVITIEGVPEIAAIARANFRNLGMENIQLIESDFDTFLGSISTYIKNKTLIFLDGNHKKEATLKYFNYVVKHITHDCVIVIDDINWSVGMNEAWRAIKASEQVALTIDLFFVGIVFFKNDFYKQNFKIRF